MERLLNARELAELLGMSQDYVYELAASGELPSFKIGGYRKFRASDVEQWLERHREGARVVALERRRA